MSALCEERECLIGCGGLAVSEGKVGTRAVFEVYSSLMLPTMEDIISIANHSLHYFTTIQHQLNFTTLA